MATDIDRRTLIKGAALAGAAAWTAPVIIDSLTSPAAAGSGACVKYYAAKYDKTAGWSNEPYSGSCALSSGTFNGHTLSNPTQFPVFTTDAGSGNSSVTIPAGCNSIQYAKAHYGNLNSSLGCGTSGNTCLTVPVTTCTVSPPNATTCGCLHASRDTLYFPAGGFSNIHVIWCCAS